MERQFVTPNVDLEIALLLITAYVIQAGNIIIASMLNVLTVKTESALSLMSVNVFMDTKVITAPPRHM